MPYETLDRSFHIRRVSVYEVAAPDVVAISVNVPVLPWLRSTEIPVAEAELSTHDWVSWPAMVSACQMRTDRASRTAMATQWDGLFGDSTASLLEAMCAGHSPKEALCSPGNSAALSRESRDL